MFKDDSATSNQLSQTERHIKGSQIFGTYLISGAFQGSRFKYYQQASK